MLTLIMAAGKGDRWRKCRVNSLSIFKPFIEVHGIRLIDRITSQLTEHQIQYMTVVSSYENSKSIPGPVLVIHPQPSLVDSILRALQGLETTSVMILLGDVLFSDTDLDNIYQPRSNKITFFGKQHELYAMCCMEDPIPLLTKVSNSLGHKSNEGKLRDVRYFASKHRGIPSKKNFNELDDRRRDRNYVQLLDWTLDIDHKLNLNKACSDIAIKQALTEWRCKQEIRTQKLSSTN